MTFANNLDPDEALQNEGSCLSSKLFDTLIIHSTKKLKGHRYISYRVYATTLQLWHPVFSRWFDNFQQNLQRALSNIQFKISSENKLCPGPIGIHGIKNENSEFLKFMRKSNFISFLSEIPQNMLSVCQALW